MGNSLMIANATDRPAVNPPPGVVLREVREGDLPATATAYWRTYLHTPHEMTLTEATDDVVASWNGEYGRWLREGSLGAWQDEELVGAIMTVSDAPWPDVPRGPFVIDLFVVPDARRHGIGRALVTAVQARISSSIGLRIDDDATAARALYASCGFGTPT